MSVMRSKRRYLAATGGAALIALGVLSAACGSNNGPSGPSTTATTTAPTPSQKSISPTGGNLFTPQVIAPAAPTEPPGVHRHHH
jgi:hypothetical protein